MATIAEIARDLTLAVIEAVGVVDTGGERQAINRNRAQEVGEMYTIIYAAVTDATSEETESTRAAERSGQPG